MPLDVRFVDASGNPLGRNGGDPVEVSVQNQQSQATTIGQSMNVENVDDVSTQTIELGPANEQTRTICDPSGAFFSHPHPPRVWHSAAEYSSAQTDTTLRSAPGEDYAIYITDIYIHVDGAVDVSLEEDGTPDVLKFRFYGQAAGDGVAHSFRCPIRLTADKALLLTTSGAVTCFVAVTGYIQYVGA